MYDYNYWTKRLKYVHEFLGGELFAKRRKKADKWVVDEGSLRSNPSQLADQFLVQQQDFQQQDYQVWKNKRYGIPYDYKIEILIRKYTWLLSVELSNIFLAKNWNQSSTIQKIYYWGCR